jgi:Fe-S oxidoreductase
LLRRRRPDAFLRTGEEEQRMGVLRVEMAAKAGANVIVTACPFCLVNMEDAIKVAGMEGKRWKPLICRN